MTSPLPAKGKQERLAKAMARALALVWRAAPRELVRLLVLNVAFGAGPSILLLLVKVVIDNTASLIAEPGTAADPLGTLLSSPVLVWSVVGFVMINIVLDSVETLTTLEVGALRDRVQGNVKSLIYEKVATLEDISLFEDPERLNVLQLAEQSIPKLQRLSVTVANLMTGFFVLVPAFLLSLSIEWWIPLVIFVAAGPSIWVQLRYQDMGWGLEHAQAGAVRRMNIYGRVLTGVEYAKELRLFRLQSRFLEGWRSLFWSAYGEMRRVRRRGAYLVVAWSLLSGLGAGLPYLFIVMTALSGRFTLGDLALYAGIVFELRRSLYVLVGSTAELQDAALSSTAVYQLMEMQARLETRLPATGGTAAAQSEKTSGKRLEVHNVSFAYPGTGRRVLKDIDLSVEVGEVVVIVGENGAGKTTLAKLLCRLYDPDDGEICWDGTDIRAIDVGEWRDKIAVMYQDYACFPATVRENIGFGLLSECDNDERILRAADQAGLRGVIDSLPAGLDTPLSRQLESGIEPSGGQWQRFAIARALLRQADSELLVLDEPTASLDARAEHDIFGVVRRMAQSRATVIISHRLALARGANQIVVLAEGRIVEAGTHDELMNRRGTYHSMFSRQAGSYVGERGQDGKAQHDNHDNYVPENSGRRVPAD